VSVALWHLEISHYNEKARWALDYKGIPHERNIATPGLHRATALMLSHGRHQRLPIVKIDGHTIADSTVIIAELERYKPEPALYPEDPELRKRALQLEDHFDEQVGPEIRRFVWHHTLDDADAVSDSLFRGQHPVRDRILRSVAPVARTLVRADYSANEESAEQAAERIRSAMDLIEREIGPSGYLAGEAFSVADLTAAALMTPLVLPPERQYAPTKFTEPVLEFRRELEARPGGQWIFEMFAKHRGSSAEINPPKQRPRVEQAIGA